jgi:hypothetical protein
LSPEAKKGPSVRPRRLHGKKKAAGKKGPKGGTSGRSRKGDGEEEDTSCGVPKCKEESERSIAYKKAREALEGWKLEKDGPRRLRVCKTHYKEFKKATKQERELDKAGWLERTGKFEPKK